MLDMSLREESQRLSDPAFYLTERFYPLLTELRQQDPVHWTQGWPDRGFWSITRYRDIRDVLQNFAAFSSQRAGSIIPADPHMYDRSEDRIAGGIGFGPAFTDPPRHDVIRKMVAKPFSAPAMGKLVQGCQKICDDAIDCILDRGECDFVNDVAAKIPMHMICALMDAPREDWGFLSKYVSSFICNTDPEFQLADTPAKTLQNAQKILFDYVRNLVRAHRSNPKEDITTLLAFTAVEGKPLSDEEVFWWAWTILLAGFETSRNVISGGLLGLLRNPEQMKLLQDDPGRGRDAADELTRYVSPSHSVFRVAVHDIVFQGREIKAGDWVVAWLASANRDEAIFARPFEMDLSRRPNPHLGFGYGTHNCLGRHIALLEIKHAIATVLHRLTNIEIVAPLVWSAATTAMGLKHMPIRFRAVS